MDFCQHCAPKIIAKFDDAWAEKLKKKTETSKTQIFILGDPGADSRGEREIKRAKSLRAEAWCEREFTRLAGTAPGRKPLTD